jgi:hypothetical protein
MHDADHCEVVQVDGSVLGSAINCAVLALLDAGVAMRGVLVATTCVVYDDDDRPGRTVVGDKDEMMNYEEDEDDGVVGSGRRGIAVRACSAPAMAAFFRIVIERKVQRKVQRIWS